MLMLLLQLNNERYALKSKQVVEVAPLVKLKKQPHAPNYVAGVFNYRGQIVPVIDLCELIQGRPCHAHLSTRIILVNYQLKYRNDEKFGAALNGQKQSCAELLTPQSLILGLMTEQVVETLNVSEADLVDPKIQVETSPYLGKMILDERGMIQCICIEDLFTEEQRSRLFAAYDTTSD